MSRAVTISAAGALTIAIGIVAGVACWPRPVVPPHVLLVSIDTLRADHLGAYGARQGLSPFIDSVAKRGAVFDDVVTPLPATGPSHAVMFTGRHPVTTGLLANGTPLGEKFETLAGRLHAAGYVTAGVTSVFHLGKPYGFARGFDQYADTTEAELRRTADAVLVDANRIVSDFSHRRDGRPLFLFVHFFDCHAAHVNHERPDGRPADASLASTIEAYDSGIRFVDSHLNQLFGILERAGLSENLVIAITSDHGEQLGEHGSTGGHADIYQETIRVPLVIAGPGIIPRRIGETTSALNLAPTLAELAGTSFSQPVDGRSLAPRLAADGRRVAKDDDVLVMGASSYTRSIAMRSRDSYFIRNLESVYRDVAVGPIPPADPVRASRASLAATVARDVNASRVFTIPSAGFQPHRIIVDIRLRPGCVADVSVALEAGIVVAGGIKVDRPTRVQYAVARDDPSFVTVTPGDCASNVTGGVTWRSEPVADSAPVFEWAGAATSRTPLFGKLVTPRKHSSSDEVYDMKKDPSMSANRIDQTPRATLNALAADLERLFRVYTRTGMGNRAREQ